MILHILFGVLLAAATFILGRTVWQFARRKAFLQAALQDSVALAHIISRGALDDPHPRFLRYLKPDIHFMRLLEAVWKSDAISQRRALSLVVLLLILVRIASYLVSYYSLGCNLLILIAVAYTPISESAQRNAIDQIFTVALVLDRWHAKDPKGCQEFIEMAYTLRPLYDAVRFAD